jgi:DNA (cytosine-5)-methyltransferase 1
VNVLSTFSSVGGLDLGLERAGMRVVAQAEVDPWRRRVLARHWPDCRIYDDVRAVGMGRRDDGTPRAGDDGHTKDRHDGWGTAAADSGDAPDLLCGGFPCQDLSVAGKRAGLAGERSGLFFEFARIADEFRPRWLLVENVPGLLSSADGRDFGIVLRTLGDLGYGLAWRVLDARFFGVPQRRRRVFVVGHSGGESEPAVRAVGAGGFGDSEARGCSWQGTPGGASVGAGIAGEGDGVIGPCEHGHPFPDVCGVCADPQSPSLGKTSSGMGVVSTLQAHKTGGYRVDAEGAAGGQLVPNGSMVRRLTPVETERLMSWPDGWTAIDGDKTPDSRRYAACGDGVVSNVAEWIGRGILREEFAA